MEGMGGGGESVMSCEMENESDGGGDRGCGVLGEVGKKKKEEAPISLPTFNTPLRRVTTCSRRSEDARTP